MKNNAWLKELSPSSVKSRGTDTTAVLGINYKANSPKQTMINSYTVSTNTRKRHLICLKKVLS